MTVQHVARRIRVPLGFLFAALFLWRAHPTALSLFSSFPIVAAGVGLRAYASGYVNKNAELATGGPYAYTRNPLYLGSLVLALGFLWAAQSWLLLACFLILFSVIYAPTIASEEAWLGKSFDGFAAYCQAVPRMFPRLTPAKLGGRGAFSSDLYRQHREYNAMVGAAAIYAVLALKFWLRY
jgi:protein-S-isoprenylcysteine O-methyltransferase Ste14